MYCVCISVLLRFVCWWLCWCVCVCCCPDELCASARSEAHTVGNTSGCACGWMCSRRCACPDALQEKRLGWCVACGVCVWMGAQQVAHVHGYTAGYVRIWMHLRKHKWMDTPQVVCGVGAQHNVCDEECVMWHMWMGAQQHVCRADVQQETDVTECTVTCVCVCDCWFWMWLMDTAHSTNTHPVINVVCVLSKQVCLSNVCALWLQSCVMLHVCVMCIVVLLLW